MIFFCTFLSISNSFDCDDSVRISTIPHKKIQKKFNQRSFTWKITSTSITDCHTLWIRAKKACMTSTQTFPVSNKILLILCFNLLAPKKKKKSRRKRKKKLFNFNLFLFITTFGSPIYHYFSFSNIYFSSFFYFLSNV